MIAAERLEERLRGLEAIGVGADGAVNRLAWSEEDAACREWFAAQAQSVGLRAVRDPAGNLWACPEAEPPWWGVGSHLDSVRSGGRFDGPLGVACGFEIAAATGAARPVAVISFADEEGARWGTPTFGSKALTGRLDPDRVLERRDDAGIALGEAMRRAGVDPAGIEDAPGWLGRLSAFVEIHIDQTTELARAGAPVALVGGLVDRLRLEVELRGRADHAGTTPRAERRDALAAAARLIVAAEELAESFRELTVTTARILASPNAPTTIAARVRLWIDARSPRRQDIEAWQRALRDRARELAEGAGVGIDVIGGLAVRRRRIRRGPPGAARGGGAVAHRERAGRGAVLRGPRRRRAGRAHPGGDGVRAQRDRDQPCPRGKHRPGRRRARGGARGASAAMRTFEIPAMPNAHSHAFQRLLRGRAERPGPAGSDDFWTWRTVMFEVAGALDPDSMCAAAEEAFREMAGAGYGDGR